MKQDVDPNVGGGKEKEGRNSCGVYCGVHVVEMSWVYRYLVPVLWYMYVLHSCSNYTPCK